MNVIETYMTKLTAFAAEYSKMMGKTYTVDMIQGDLQLLRRFCLILVNESMQGELKTEAVRTMAQPSAAPTTTSGKAFKAVDESGKRLTQRERVFNFIKANPNCSREDIQYSLDMLGNSLQPRVRELLDEARIYVSGVKPGSNGLDVETLKVYDVK